MYVYKRDDGVYRNEIKIKNTIAYESDYTLNIYPIIDN